MSSAFQRYRDSERELVYTRWLNEGFESQEEDRILEEMDVVWWDLSEEERNVLNSEPPKGLIRELPSLPAERMLMDVSPAAFPGEPVRQLREVA